MWNEVSEIISAVLSNDAWMMNSALKTSGAWVVGALVTVIGGIFFLQT